MVRKRKWGREGRRAEREKGRKKGEKREGIQKQAENKTKSSHPLPHPHMSFSIYRKPKKKPLKDSRGKIYHTCV